MKKNLILIIEKYDDDVERNYIFEGNTLKKFNPEFYLQLRNNKGNPEWILDPTSINAPIYGRYVIDEIDLINFSNNEYNTNKLEEFEFWLNDLIEAGEDIEDYFDSIEQLEEERSICAKGVEVCHCFANFYNRYENMPNYFLDSHDQSSSGK